MKGNKSKFKKRYYINNKIVIFNFEDKMQK